MEKLQRSLSRRKITFAKKKKKIFVNYENVCVLLQTPRMRFRRTPPDLNLGVKTRQTILNTKYSRIIWSIMFHAYSSCYTRRISFFAGIEIHNDSECGSLFK